MSGDPPKIHLEQYSDFRVPQFLREVVYLQKLGFADAVQVLSDMARSSSDGQQVFLLCRVLFEEKDKLEFRGPMIGAADFFEGTSYDDWPREPVALVGNIPFVIVKGYILTGSPELPESYLDYCMKNCRWTSTQYHMPSVAEMRGALAKLLQSGKWKQPLTDYEKRYFEAQILE